MKLKEVLVSYFKGIFEIVSLSGLSNLYRFFSDYRVIKKSIESKISIISSRYHVDDPGISFQKYLDIDYWLFENMRRCYRLGLHDRSRSLKILDIGTGAAYFPYVCRYYGHDVEAIDLSDNDMYNEIIEAFGIRRYDQCIRSFTDLVTDKRYDLVTAFMICFNCHKRPDLWHISEWKHFLASLHARNLSPGGRIFLSFNAESPDEPVSKQLLDYFSENGADVRGSEVYIRNSDRFVQ